MKCTPDSHVPSGIRGRALTYCISHASRAANSCSPRSALPQNLTTSNFYPLNCSILCTKNNLRNSQTTYFDIHGTIHTGPENLFHHHEKSIIKVPGTGNRSMLLTSSESCQCFEEDVCRGDYQIHSYNFLVYIFFSSIAKTKSNRS